MTSKTKLGVCAACAALDPPDLTEKSIRARSMCVSHYEKWRRVTKKARNVRNGRVTKPGRVKAERPRAETEKRMPTLEGWLAGLPPGWMTAIKGIRVGRDNTNGQR